MVNPSTFKFLPSIKSKEIHNLLKQLIQFFDSFPTVSAFPIAEVLKSDTDLVLALLMQMNFGEHHEQIRLQLVSISVFLSCLPECFVSRLFRFGVVDFLIKTIRFEANGDYACMAKLLSFMNNLLCDSVKALDYFDEKGVLSDVSRNLNYLLADSRVKQKVIVLFTNISSPFC